MKPYADTGLLVSLLLPETTTAAAIAAVAPLSSPLPLLPLGLLELRNALNFAIHRGRITPEERDALGKRLESQIRSGFFTLVHLPSADLHEKARELSDRYTPSLATRSLDLLHVAAALLLGADTLLSFDSRQCRAAAAEGLIVIP
ncbi:MAG: twitching motility protein PilT [Verrucomicrobiaceae bacterium]|nr:twitching motility protein PilT [Verrucomicrobiaceae bacterium]